MATHTTEAGSTSRRAGWRLVAVKELGDHFQSIRLLILVALLGLVGVGAVLASATGIREVAEGASGAPAVFLALFWRTAEDSRLPSFYQALSLLGPLLGIAFGFDAVNGERAQGTLPRLLSQPIYRDDVINGKFAAGLATIGLVLVGLASIVAGLGMVRLGVVPTIGEVVRLLGFLAVTLVYVGFWLALATLFSVVLRRASSSALASIAAWLITTLFAAVLVGLIADVIAPVGRDATFDEQLSNARWQLQLGRLSPSTLYEEAATVLLDPTVRALGIVFREQVIGIDLASTLPLDQSVMLALGQIVGLVSLTLIVFGIAYVAFMRQEVRA